MCRQTLMLRAVSILAVCWSCFPTAAENVDPGAQNLQFAWSENTGWINLEPLGDGGPGVTVGNFELSGWMYGENAGWISLSCENTASCATVDYGVTNDGTGQLGGWAFAENAGWVSFSCQNTGSCGTVFYGVAIDLQTGFFSGDAWAENLGWIRFASTGQVPYGVRTSWTCYTQPVAPLTLSKITADGFPGTTLEWPDASTAFDVIQGDLETLRTTGGDFTVATTACLQNGGAQTSLTHTDDPASGEGFWFLVRGVDCFGAGTYDAPDAPAQAAPRDAAIEAAPEACP